MVARPLSSAASAPSSGYVVTRPVLHRGHFAFLRAVVQGLSPRTMWERYLGADGDFDDAPRVHRMTAWIRKELAASVARAGYFGRAHLLRLDLEAGNDGDMPTLEEFVAAAGLEDFTETEQLAHYNARYGDRLDRERRRTALVRRQLLAIHALEAHYARPVLPADGCEAWLVEPLAQRLRAAGIATLGALHARIASGGRWWQDLPGVGVAKATALARFVAAHADTLGPLVALVCDDAEAPPAPGVPAAETRAAELSPVMPIDRLRLPAQLDGHAGRFRGPQDRCLLDAEDDQAAIAAWLASKAPGPMRHAGCPAVPNGAPGDTSSVASRPSCTQLAYRKEAERLLLWAVLERRKPLSSLAVEDASAYREFLLAPPPTWCAGHVQPRWRSTWRPFLGPLSPRSCAYALSVVGNLFGFLVEQGYLIGNPWPAVTRPCDLPRGPDVDRGFSQAQWRFLQQQLEALPPGLPALRLQLALLLLHDTGLRLAELVAATCDDLTWESLAQPPAAPVEGWWLRVTGKGAKVRRVPVSPAAVARLSAYLVARGLPADPLRARSVALLGALPAHRVGQGNAVASDAAQGISTSSFHRQLKAFLARCAEHLAVLDPSGAQALSRASTHWLRHTHVSHALDCGVPVQVVQQNVGHASLDTTSRYVRTEDARRMQAMQKMWSS